MAGIVTTSDVIAALLVAMNKEVERLEIENLNAQNLFSEDGKGKERSNLLQKAKGLQNLPNRVIEFKTEPFNFETAGQASTDVKKNSQNYGNRAGIKPENWYCKL